jgi:hypothetical protein
MVIIDVSTQNSRMLMGTESTYGGFLSFGNPIKKTIKIVSDFIDDVQTKGGTTKNSKDILRNLALNLNTKFANPARSAIPATDPKIIVWINTNFIDGQGVGLLQQNIKSININGTLINSFDFVDNYLLDNIFLSRAKFHLVNRRNAMTIQEIILGASKDGFPKGKQENAETSLQAAHREFLEEIGYDLNNLLVAPNLIDLQPPGGGGGGGGGGGVTNVTVPNLINPPIPNTVYYVGQDTSMKTDIYCIFINTQSNIQAIMTAYQNHEIYSELFNVGFRNAQPPRINQPSADAIRLIRTTVPIIPPNQGLGGGKPNYEQKYLKYKNKLENIS